MKKIILLVLCQFTITYLSFAQGLPLPYYTGFDSPSELAGWQEFRTGFQSTYSWGAGGSIGFSNTACISHDYNVGGSATDTVIDWYVSPPLNVSSTSKVSLKVHTSGFSTPTPDNCEVYFATGSPDPTIGNFTLIGNISYMTPQFTWLDTIFNIPSLSDSEYIAIKYKTIGAAWSVYRIDNINVTPDSGVGISKNIFEENAFDIYPNPFKDNITISVDEKYISTGSTIVVSDIYGKEVSKNVILSKVFSVNPNSIPGGMYLIRLIQNGNVVSSRKVIAE